MPPPARRPASLIAHTAPRRLVAGRLRVRRPGRPLSTNLRAASGRGARRGPALPHHWAGAGSGAGRTAGSAPCAGAVCPLAPPRLSWRFRRRDRATWPKRPVQADNLPEGGNRRGQDGIACDHRHKGVARLVHVHDPVRRRLDHRAQLPRERLGGILVECAYSHSQSSIRCCPSYRSAIRWHREMNLLASSWEAPCSPSLSA